jgi:hypothetical protein
MATSAVESSRLSFVYTATVSRSMLGSRWQPVERVTAALADDPVASALPADISVRESTGESPVDGLRGLVATAARRDRSFDVIDARLRRPPTEIRMVVCRRWFGARFDFVCRSEREAEALGLAALVRRHLRRRRVGRFERRERRRLSRLLQAPWFIGLTIMALGLLLADLLSR